MSSPMEGEHISTIIWLILSTDHASIQLKDSFKIFSFPNNPPQWMEIKEIDTL